MAPTRRNFSISKLRRHSKNLQRRRCRQRLELRSHSILTHIHSLVLIIQRRWRSDSHLQRRQNHQNLARVQTRKQHRCRYTWQHTGLEVRVYTLRISQQGRLRRRLVQKDWPDCNCLRRRYCSSVSRRCPKRQEWAIVQYGLCNGQRTHAGRQLRPVEPCKYRTTSVLQRRRAN